MRAHRSRILLLLVMTFGLLSILASCQKWRVTVESSRDVITKDATDIRSTRAHLNAQFSRFGKGVDYFISISNSAKDSKSLVIDGEWYEVYQSSWPNSGQSQNPYWFYQYYTTVDNLQPSTEYFFVACIRDGNKYYCGDVKSFTTLP